MRLSCVLVSRMLGSRVGSEPVPNWVEKHLCNCARCRAEAEEYSRLSQVIKQSAAADETLSLKWQQLRATLPIREPNAARRAPLLSLATAAVVVAMAICVALSLQSGRNSVQLASHQPHAVTRRGSVEQNKVVQPPPQQQIQLVAQEQPKQSQHTTLTRRSVVELPRVKPQIKQSDEVPSLKRDAPEDVAANPEPAVEYTPDPPAYKVVGAEEHVISVVGVRSTTEDADTSTSYVIRNTDTGDDHQVVLL